MSKDIQVFTALDAKVKPAEKLDILLLSTEGAAAMKTYNNLEIIQKDFEGKKVAAMATKLFEQDNTLAGTLIRRVRIAGVENPQNEGGSASTITVVFLGEKVELAANTTYYAKIGGKAVVQITTGDTTPTTGEGLSALFAGTSFMADGVAFQAAVDSNGVVFTSTTHTAISGYDTTFGLYTDADCMVAVSLEDAETVPESGRPDVTRARQLIQAIEDLRDRDDDFYIVLTDITNRACVEALCAWAESTEPTEAALGAGVEDHRKFFFGQTSDKEYVNEYGRSAVIYSDAPETEWADAAWVGCCGPFWPESVTWKWKAPDGLAVPDLRDSERDTLEENRVNFMTAEYKHRYIKNGICGDGNFIDNVLGADYITYQMRENLYNTFLSNPKIGYTDEGFALVASGVFSALNQAVSLHIITKDPESGVGVFTVTIPKRAKATDQQAANRQMPNIEWEAQLEGAVHGVKVRGVLSVTLKS